MATNATTNEALPRREINLEVITPEGEISFITVLEGDTHFRIPNRPLGVQTEPLGFQRTSERISAAVLQIPPNVGDSILLYGYRITNRGARETTSSVAAGFANRAELLGRAFIDSHPLFAREVLFPQHTTGNLTATTSPSVSPRDWRVFETMGDGAFNPRANAGLTVGQAGINPPGVPWVNPWGNYASPGETVYSREADQLQALQTEFSRRSSGLGVSPSLPQTTLSQELLTLLKDNLQIRIKLGLSGTDISARLQVVFVSEDTEVVVCEDEDTLDVSDLFDNTY